MDTFAYLYVSISQNFNASFLRQISDFLKLLLAPVPRHKLKIDIVIAFVYTDILICIWIGVRCGLHSYVNTPTVVLKHCVSIIVPKCFNYFNCFFLWIQVFASPGTTLETLPEAESEEESCSTTASEASNSGQHENTSSSSEDESCENGLSESSRFSAVGPLLSCQPSSSLMSLPTERVDGADLRESGACDPHVEKISFLESMIQRLEDELRECKDQNELLEFRLLEMEDMAPTSNCHKKVMLLFFTDNLLPIV